MRSKLERGSWIAGIASAILAAVALTAQCTQGQPNTPVQGTPPQPPQALGGIDAIYAEVAKRRLEQNQPALSKSDIELGVKNLAISMSAQPSNASEDSTQGMKRLLEFGSLRNLEIELAKRIRGVDVKVPDQNSLDTIEALRRLYKLVGDQRQLANVSQLYLLLAPQPATPTIQPSKKVHVPAVSIETRTANPAFLIERQSTEKLIATPQSQEIVFYGSNLSNVEFLGTAGALFCTSFMGFECSANSESPALCVTSQSESTITIRTANLDKLFNLLSDRTSRTCEYELNFGLRPSMLIVKRKVVIEMP
jgi:hypothetical protein